MDALKFPARPVKGKFATNVDRLGRMFTMDAPLEAGLSSLGITSSSDVVLMKL